MKPQPKNLGAWLKELVVFCVLGVAAGAGVGFFMFVRLGFPKESYMIGYMSGLFLSSGLRLGISLWFVRIVFRALLHLWADGSFCASRYHFRDMDLQSGSLEQRTNLWAAHADANLHPQIDHALMNSTSLNVESFHRDDSLVS
jgi:hypothetical protein